MALDCCPKKAKMVLEKSYAQALQQHPLAIKTHTQGVLAAISPHPIKEMAVVCGRDILKIYSTTQNPQELFNLRLSKNALNLSYSDVIWGGQQVEHVIVVACNSGAILVYDPRKSTLDKLERTIQEHSRAVHRLCFSPFDASNFISGSQDGTMKCWDLRMKQRSYRTFDGKSESVRDVQFNPRNPYSFAAVFDNGMLQVWDTRFPLQCISKWSAHNGLALCLDHDSSGTRICTGGRDKMIKIWDLSSDSRKPVQSIQTIASVARCKWRPKHEQIASCSLSYDNRVQVWDINKSYIPVLTWEEHQASVTDICWKNAGELWSCSKDEYFIINSVSTGYEPERMLPNSTIGVSTLGLLVSALKKSDGEQQLLVTDDFRVETGQIAYLAQNYISDSSLTTTCMHNKLVCEKIGLMDIAAFWEIIKQFFNSPAIERTNLCKTFMELKSISY